MRHGDRQQACECEHYDHFGGEPLAHRYGDADGTIQRGSRYLCRECAETCEPFTDTEGVSYTREGVPRG